MMVTCAMSLWCVFSFEIYQFFSRRVVRCLGTNFSFGTNRILNAEISDVRYD